MISENSSWKIKMGCAPGGMAYLMRENGKRRLWLFAFLSFIMLCSYPVTMVLGLNRYGMDRLADRQEFAFDLLGIQNTYTVFLLTVGAMVCAVNGFSWLYSRKKADMYLSQPVSAKSRFLTIYLNGILIYYIPYMISLFLGILAATGMGAASAAMLMTLCHMLLAGFIYFLAVYNLMTAAAMLTGHTAAASFLGLVFLLYETVLRVVLDEYCALYFSTFARRTKMKGLFSPVSRIVTVYQKNQLIWENQAVTVAEVWEKQILPMLPGFLLLLAEAVLFGFAAFFCYKKRPAEASGRAIAFPEIKEPLKVLLMVLSGLLGSCIFCEISNSTKPYIAVLGLIFGILFCQAVMEMIYEGDIRAFLSHKKSFAAGAALALICYLFFAWDISGYNTWVPDAEQVESAAVEIEFDNRYWFEYADEKFRKVWNDSYELEHMAVKDVSGILSLARDGMGKDAPEQDINKQLRCTVKYTMKNGAEKYRIFFIDYEKEQRVLDILFANEEYKRGKHQILEERMDTLFQNGRLRYSNGLQEAQLPDKDVYDLMKAYQKDVYDMSFTDIKEVIPCGTLELVCSYPNGTEGSLKYPVFPSYQRTLAYLQGKNISYLLEITPEAVDNIRVVDYNTPDGMEIVDKEMQFFGASTTMESVETANKSAEYRDREQIEELLAHSYPSSLSGWAYASDKGKKEFQVVLYPADNEEALMYHWDATDFLMDAADAPDFVAKDLESNDSNMEK